MPEELPLNDKPPRVVIKSDTTRALLQRIGGVHDSIEILKKLGVKMPGIQFSIAALEAKYSDDRITLFTRLYKAAQVEKVDFSSWVVVGAKYIDDEPCIDLMAIDQADEG